MNDIENSMEDAGKTLLSIKEELKKFMVGQDAVIDQVLIGVIAGGHVLLEGLPGLGKTMLIKKISEVLDLKFSRIQFTPDLMPADITGTHMVQPDEQGKQKFVFHEGPLFTNILLADEINRATPKTQSALLEAMAEKTVTALGEERKLSEPFFVLATQNPIELEGTYPLPEAQLDRFLLKADVAYPSASELKEIARRTTGKDVGMLQKKADANFILSMRELSKQLLVSEHVMDYAVSLLMAAHPEEQDASELAKRYVRYGPGPRGLQGLISAAKVHAIENGRVHVSKEDIKAFAKPVLRHRLFLNFEGQAEEINPDHIIDEMIIVADQKAVGNV